MSIGRVLLFGALTVVSALLVPGVVGAAEVSRLDRDPPRIFRGLFGADSTVTAVIERARALFSRSDVDGNGQVNAADGRFADQVSKAIVRAGAQMNVFQYDLDGDGVVTEAELRSILAYERRVKGPRAALVGTTDETFEDRIRTLMAIDLDHDGRVTFSEILSAARKAVDGTGQVGGMEAVMIELLEYAGTSEGVSEKTFVELVEERAREIDADGDGRLTKAEIDASTLRRAERIKAINAERRRTADEEQRRRAAAREVPACQWPRPSPEAAFLLVSVSESQALSSATIESQSREVEAATVVVEPGTPPVSLVLLSGKPIIWRFTGAVERIERAVVISAHVSDAQATDTIAGVSGLPADRVMFAPRCVQAFTVAPSIEASKVAGNIRAATDREPLVVATHTMTAVRVPGGDFDVLPREGAPSVSVRDSSQSFAIFGGRLFDVTDATLAQKVRWAHPAGVMAIDPKTVVASRPVSAYEILPGLAGVAQLVASGALARNASGEYLIRQKIRLPGAMFGSRVERFLLLKGVPVPDGDPGDACIYSEETGKPVLGSDGCS